MGKTYESKEYQQHLRRNGRPYSVGHQLMYKKAIDVIKESAPKPRVLEIGFGIGFGLTKMVEANLFHDYVGLEPNKESFDYTATTLGLGDRPDVALYNVGFDEAMAQEFGSVLSPYDETFCIEVIEHVPMDEHLQFLIALRSISKRLWLSTPDSKKSKEGVRTMRDWTILLRQAKFDVTVDTSQWTYLYRCE